MSNLADTADSDVDPEHDEATPLREQHGTNNGRRDTKRSSPSLDQSDEGDHEDEGDAGEEEEEEGGEEEESELEEIEEEEAEVLEPRVLPSRETRGRRMHTFAGEEAEADEAFWGHDTWAEEAGDEEWSTEDEAHYRDYADADFFETTTEEEEEEEAAERRRAEQAEREENAKERRKAMAYQDPRKLLGKTRTRYYSAKAAATRPAPPPAARPRMELIRAGIPVAGKVVRGKRRGVLAQEDHLEIAAKMELQNTKRLTERLDHETWKKAMKELKQATSVWSGPMSLTISWASDRVIEAEEERKRREKKATEEGPPPPVTSRDMLFFVDFDHPPNSAIPAMYTKPPAPPPKPRFCTMNPSAKALYRDPHTGEYFSDLAAYRVLKQRLTEDGRLMLRSRLAGAETKLKRIIRYLRMHNLFPSPDVAAAPPPIEEEEEEPAPPPVVELAAPPPVQPEEAAMPSEVVAARVPGVAKPKRVKRPGVELIEVEAAKKLKPGEELPPGAVPPPMGLLLPPKGLPPPLMEPPRKRGRPPKAPPPVGVEPKPEPQIQPTVPPPPPPGLVMRPPVPMYGMVEAGMPFQPPAAYPPRLKRQPLRIRTTPAGFPAPPGAFMPPSGMPAPASFFPEPAAATFGATPYTGGPMYLPTIQGAPLDFRHPPRPLGLLPVGGAGQTPSFFFDPVSGMMIPSAGGAPGPPFGQPQQQFQQQLQQQLQQQQHPYDAWARPPPTPFSGISPAAAGRVVTGVPQPVATARPVDTTGRTPLNLSRVPPHQALPGDHPVARNQLTSQQPYQRPPLPPQQQHYQQQHQGLFYLQTPFRPANHSFSSTPQSGGGGSNDSPQPSHYPSLAPPEFASHGTSPSMYRNPSPSNLGPPG